MRRVIESGPEESEGASLGFLGGRAFQADEIASAKTLRLAEYSTLAFNLYRPKRAQSPLMVHETSGVPASTSPLRARRKRKGMRGLKFPSILYLM